MLFLILVLGAAVVAVLLVRTLRSEQPASEHHPLARFPWSADRRTDRTRTAGPDDDPAFLRELDEKVRNQDDPPDRT